MSYTHNRQEDSEPEGQGETLLCRVGVGMCGERRKNQGGLASGGQNLGGCTLKSEQRKQQGHGGSLSPRTKCHHALVP